MAFTATAVWEVRTAGDDVNHGGGFDRGVAGFPTDGAATVATGNSPVFTSASYTFVAGDVGAWVYIKSGTNWTSGWYLISSVNAGAATLNAAVGAAVLDSGTPNTVAGCASTASPTGGTWGLDYSQQDAGQIVFSDMVIGTAGNETKFTSTLNPVGKNFVGNIIKITAGTGFTVQRVAIVSTSTVTATCDKALGTAESTGGVGELGGALASPGQASVLHVGGNKIWVLYNAAVYAVAYNTERDGGVVVIKDPPGGSNPTGIEGYTTVRGDRTASKPVLQLAAGVSTATIVTLPNASSWCCNIMLDGNSQTASRAGYAPGIYGPLWLLCDALNCTNGGFRNGLAIQCTSTGHTSSDYGGFDSLVAMFCEAFDGAGLGFRTCKCVGCISHGNSTGFTDYGSVNNTHESCIAHGNAAEGWDLRSSYGGACINCISEGNGTFGWRGDAVTNFRLINCAGWNNTSGNGNGNFILPLGFIAGVIGSFFTNAAAGDFSLNNTAGCGALLRATGFPALFPRGLTANYRDIGAAQHADPAGGSGGGMPVLGGSVVR